MLDNDSMKSLYGQGQADEKRYYSREDTKRLYDRIIALSSGGETSALIQTSWTGNLRWARNRPISAGDTTNHTVQLERVIRGASASVGTNNFTDEGLKVALRTAEKTIGFRSENPDASDFSGEQQYVSPEIWSGPTYDLNATERSNIARLSVEPIAAEKLYAAGYLQVGARTRAVYNTQGMNGYYAGTVAQFSITVRNPAGTGSGWAGVDSHDWKNIDVKKLCDIALEKCLKSADPRAVEPGRYTVILEPQAVHDLMVRAIYALDRYSAENFQTVYTLRPGQSKIGLKVFDDRITISSDPSDPEAGYLPLDYQGYPYRAIKWVENGVLKELAYSRLYALSQLGHGDPLPNAYSYRINGGTSTMDEMIAGTRRGFIVTRLSNIITIDNSSLLLSGVTRDGLWLVENGKITHAVKNFRFAESPMFAFNNVEHIGAAQRVLAAYPTIVPSMKVADFNFTSLSDAV